MIGKEEDGLEAEFPMAEVKQILERWTEEIDDHGVVVALGAIPPNERNADAASEGLVDLGLVLELRMLGLDRFELDGDLLAGDDVYAEVDIT